MSDSDAEVVDNLCDKMSSDFVADEVESVTLRKTSNYS